jgi:hypothetical protein
MASDTDIPRRVRGQPRTESLYCLLHGESDSWTYILRDDDRSLQALVIVGMFFSGWDHVPFSESMWSQAFLGRTFLVTSSSRLMYAFFRDHPFPGSKFLSKVDQWCHSPNRCGSSLLMLTRANQEISRKLTIAPSRSVISFCSSH